MARVLVTGASGFTGGHLVQRLACQGRDVRALVRNPESCRLAELGVDLRLGDLRDYESLVKATEDVDIVYHIAATFRQEAIDRQAFWDINATGTERLIEASVRNGVKRFVHCSTVGVHGHIATPPANEDAPCLPGDIYQESKLEGERIASRYLTSDRIGMTIFRPAGIHGPGDMRFLKLFRAVHRRRFMMIGDGKAFYHLTYIEDLIDGILLCGSVEKAIGQIFILAGEEYVTLKDLVAAIAMSLEVRPPRLRVPVWPVYLAAYGCEALCRPLRVEPPLYRRRVDFFTKSRAFDISKSRRLLGFSPKFSINEGINRTANWYREQNYL